MEKPKTPETAATLESKEKGPQKMRKPPTPEELISYYESQGMDSKAASIKVIQDLQGILLRAIGSNARGKTANPMAEMSRKLDTVNTRLAILEMKLDTKPGYLDSLTIGVAAGATLKGIGSVFPHVVGAFGQIWNAVRSSSNARP
ncbi:uncharacterized protein LOC131217502 [Magnolia sinica]|uniref:uncharacterized protein LOC131217502 n=1 Tax=Magnolia sinica TaxID=86752 RepID=UPI002659961C|nr:uncharacterized protein LOC131217502 [Magnolia sinica]